MRVVPTKKGEEKNGNQKETKKFRVLQQIGFRLKSVLFSLRILLLFLDLLGTKHHKTG